MIKKVYSYMRFSRPEQAKGSSIERQARYAEEYAEKHGFELDKTLTMTDKGLSAFHGVNKKKGAFGVFLKAVEEGKVEKGSVLIVESLDRISRQNPLIAQKGLTDLVLEGITVVTASDGQVYSKAEFDENPFKLIMSLVVMIRAHEESETKQKRSYGFLISAVNQYQSEGRTRTFGADPSWVDFDTESKVYTLNDRANVIKRIIDLYGKGIGSLKIARILTEEGIPTPSGRRKEWGLTTVANIIKSHALYGMKQINVQGVDYELEDFYPPLMTYNEWLGLQQHRKKRSKSMHGRGDAVHLITGHGKGYLTCAHCGGSMGAQSQKQYKRSGEYTKTVTRLHCLNHKETGSCTSSVFLKPIEDSVIFATAAAINPVNMAEQKPQVDYDALINECESKLRKIGEQMADLMLKDKLNELVEQGLNQKIKSLEEERDKYIKLKSEQAPVVSKSEVIQGVLRLTKMAALAKSGNTDARLEVRGLIKSLCKNIVVNMAASDSEATVGIKFVTDSEIFYNVDLKTGEMFTTKQAFEGFEQSQHGSEAWYNDANLKELVDGFMEHRKNESR